MTVLEMKDSIGSDLGSLRKIAVMMKMQQLQVKLLPNSKVCRFTEEGIVLEDNTLIPCDCAVFAVGFAANDSHALAEVCEKRDIPYQQEERWMPLPKDLKLPEHCRRIRV